MENLILAIALLCKQNYNYPQADQRSCAKKILECYAKNKNTSLNQKIELEKFAMCLDFKAEKGNE